MGRKVNKLTQEPSAKELSPLGLVAGNFAPSTGQETALSAVSSAQSLAPGRVLGPGVVPGREREGKPAALTGLSRHPALCLAALLAGHWDRRQMRKQKSSQRWITRSKPYCRVSVSGAGDQGELSAHRSPIVRRDPASVQSVLLPERVPMAGR